MRFIEIRFLGRVNRNISNPMSTLTLIPFISVPQILGVLFWDNFFIALLSTLFIGILFTSTYILGIKYARKSRIF